MKRALLADLVAVAGAASRLVALLVAADAAVAAGLALVADLAARVAVAAVVGSGGGGGGGGGGAGVDGGDRQEGERGEDEVRAWPIVRGTKAPQAAGVIHTDLEKGFIRAEVVAYDDLMAAGSLAEARKRGQLRQEGRTYVVQDGDVLNILFSK